MSTPITVKTATNNLEELLTQLPLGETVTLLDESGQPLALLVSLKAASRPEAQSATEWRANLEALAEKVNAAWKSDKGAVETLVEMRR